MSLLLWLWVGRYKHKTTNVCVRECTHRLQRVAKSRADDQIMLVIVAVCLCDSYVGCRKLFPHNINQDWYSRTLGNTFFNNQLPYLFILYTSFILYIIILHICIYILFLSYFVLQTGLIFQQTTIIPAFKTRLNQNGLKSRAACQKRDFILSV